MAVRTVELSRFKVSAYVILGTMLYLMLVACDRPEPFHKSVTLTPELEVPEITATFDPRTSSTSPSAPRATRTRVVIRPAAS